MRRYLLPLFFVFIFLTSCISASVPVEDETASDEAVRVRPEGEAIKVGVLAIRSASAANAQYGAILTYLEDELGRPFELVPVTQTEQFQKVENNEVDFTLNNPLAAVQIQRLYDTKFLATLSRPNTGTQFSSLIIVRTDSGIETIEDLKGKNGTCVAHQTAAAGCNFQVFHLLQKGVDPYTDFATFTETPSQDNIVLGVLNREFDVGFIRTGQLERMLSEGVLTNLEDITILDQSDDDFFFPHTTRLYPEWPFAALAQTDPELANAVQDALLKLEGDHPAMQNAKANGFVADVDYLPIDELIIELQLKSWDEDNRN